MILIFEDIFHINIERNYAISVCLQSGKNTAGCVHTHPNNFHLRVDRSPYPSAPVPLFVHFVDFRKFRVGDGGGYDRGQHLTELFLFRVFVFLSCISCDDLYYPKNLTQIVGASQRLGYLLR